MKRANGTGSVVKLPGNRRAPWAVKVPVRDRRGRVRQRYLSYHAKSADAQAALEELPTLLQFDLVIVSPDTSPELLRNIQLEGVTLYAADEM